jgi:hypothetical protein
VVKLRVRKTVTLIERTHIEGGRELASPGTRVVAAAVIANPLAGRYEEDLSDLIEFGEQLGQMLGEDAAAALGPATVESFGKAGIVGTAGELEHVAALLHPSFGKPARAAIGGGPALIPSSKKRAGPGTHIDIPLHYRHAAFVRSHFDAIDFGITDAPAADEVVVAFAVTDGGRPLARVGGLQRSEVRGDDGLR